jgi:hypothetical protein
MNSCWGRHIVLPPQVVFCVVRVGVCVWSLLDFLTELLGRSELARTYSYPYLIYF